MNATILKTLHSKAFIKTRTHYKAT